jgi:predicted CXXCH cytochrome family protein
MLLSRASTASAAVEISICASCHVRTGRSRSTGLPYPNHFVPGDNLFRDFAVDLSDEAVTVENPGERHVLENIREVILRGETDATCVSCHDVHQESSAKHARAKRRELCFTCHNETGDARVVKSYEPRSVLCRY